jgi:hypothetical protein
MDAGILEQVLSHIHNWFDHGQIGLSGCAISEGRLPASISIPEGAWYRIQGSLFNDGLHKHPADDLTDETFDGTITVCAIPNALLEVVEEIEDWQTVYREGRNKALGSPYTSESFDGYSYSMRDYSGADSASGGLSGWQAEFAGQLNAFRKMY